MPEPVPLSTSAAYVGRLVDRLVFLHDCDEQAVAQLGLARRSAVTGAPVAVARSAPEAVVVPGTGHSQAD